MGKSKSVLYFDEHYKHPYALAQTLNVHPSTLHRHLKKHGRQTSKGFVLNVPLGDHIKRLKKPRKALRNKNGAFVVAYNTKRGRYDVVYEE